MTQISEERIRDIHDAFRLRGAASYTVGEFDALCRRALEAGQLAEDKRNLARLGTEACHDGMRLARELEEAKAERDRLEAENAKLREQLADLLTEPECTEGCRL